MKFIYNFLAIICRISMLGIPAVTLLNSKFYSLMWFIKQENMNWFIDNIMFFIPQSLGLEDTGLMILFNYVLFLIPSLIYSLPKLKGINLFCGDGVFSYSVVFLFFPFGIWSIAPVFALPLLAGFLFKRAAEYFDDKVLDIKINEEE